MTDFHAKALAAAASVSSQTPAEALAQSLTNATPKIDSAVKSFVALTSARAASAGSTPGMTNHTMISNDDSGQKKCFFVKSKNPQMAPLLCARVILQKLNNFKIPDDYANDEKNDEIKNLEFQVVRILWNGLVSHGKKPSKILGIEALHFVYPMVLQTLRDSIPDAVDAEEGQAFMQEFGSLLNNAINRRVTLSLTEKDRMNACDDDSCLLWDPDGGEDELKRRRDRREQNANAAKESLENHTWIQSNSDSQDKEELAYISKEKNV